MSISNRNRAHPPSILTIEELMTLDPMTKLTAYGLRHFVDDEGRESANPTIIRAQLWPLDASMTDETIIAHLIQLEDAGYLQLYSAGKKTLFQIIEWPAVDRGKKSRFPAPPEPRESFSQPVLATCARDLYAVEEREGERGREGEDESERESESGEESAEGRARGPAGEEPPLYCSKHQPYGTEDKCGPCGTRRRAHEKWLRDGGRS